MYASFFVQSYGKYCFKSWKSSIIVQNEFSLWKLCCRVRKEKSARKFKGRVNTSNQNQVVFDGKLTRLNKNAVQFQNGFYFLLLINKWMVLLKVKTFTFIHTQSHGTWSHSQWTIPSMMKTAHSIAGKVVTNGKIANSDANLSK